MPKIFISPVLILGLIALICAGCKQSGPESVKNATDFAQMTFAKVKAGADNGDPGAQYELGYRFHVGKDVLKDPKAAVEWWQKSAAQKYPPAELSLGLAYANGDGVPKNEQEGTKLCRLAAVSGFARAEETMGILYFLGVGADVQKDYPQALHWFKLAADQGWPPSQYLLALCYRDGKGTPTNSAEAVSELQQAASNGLANAQVALGHYYFDKGFAELGIPARVKPDVPVTQEQLTNQNFVTGVEWYRKAANQGYSPGQFFLAFAYGDGAGVAKDPIECYKWFVLANQGPHGEVWKMNTTNLSPEQISTGKQRAEEFLKTNHVAPMYVPEIPGL